MSLTLNFNLRITILTVIFLPILISLGFWQIERADEKHSIISEISKVKRAPALPWHATNLLPYQLVTVEGSFDENRYWLLDNQVRRGKVGFDVIMPFVSKGTMILVNRGWVEGDLSRRTLPSFETPLGTLKITARTYKPFVKLEAYDKGKKVDWPRIIGNLNIAGMAADIKINHSEYILRLQQDSSGALHTGWPEINVSAAKHKGYAVQWFAMAFALLLMYVLSSSNILSLLSKKANNKRNG